MIKKALYLSFCFVFVALSSFGQQSYYSPDGKMTMDLSLKKAVLKFNPSADFQAQKQILANYDQIEPLTREQVLPAPLVTLINLKNVTSEAELLNLLASLESQDAVLYANPFLAHKDGTLHGITDQLVVGIQSASDVQVLRNLVTTYGASLDGHNEFDHLMYHITVQENSQGNALELANLLHETGLFQYSEPDFLRLMKRMNTNDTYVNSQWSLNNDGSNTSTWGGTPGIDMDVFNAWGINTGSSGIRVAILDEGVDLSHPDLLANLDSGYDATGQGSGGNPSGDDAHGTACAGIVAAVGNNNLGVAGVAYGSRIVPVRIAYSSGSSWVTNNTWISNAINWSWDTGNADVLSNSWGGGGSSTAINNAITNALTSGRGGLGSPVLFAAGNDNGSVSYPATNNNTIAVIAMSMCAERKSPSSCDNETWWGSNYGTNADVAAPGVKIYATDISGSAGYSSGDYISNFNGTSSATPNAAGVMALILSQDGSLTASQARQVLESTTDKVGGYTYNSNVSGQPNGTWSTQLGYGLINANAALQSIAPQSPNNAGISGIAAPAGNICAASATPSVTLQNYGSNALTSVTINYDVDGGSNNTQNWTGNLSPGSSTSVTLSSISFSGGTHTFNASTSNPNGTSDTDPANDDASSSFYSGTNDVTLTLVLDNYPSETSWDIRDAQGNIVASGSGYSGAGSTVVENACLADGCFDLNVYDSYGDGMCCAYGNGSYTLTETSTGNVLASGGEFNSQETTNFCVPTGGGNPLSISITNSSDVSCNGGSDGSATAAASGGTGSYTYNWSNGANGATANNLSAGTYGVTVNDGNTTASASVNISEPSALSLSISGTNANGGNNGSADLTVSGGTPGYSYLWSNGATTQDISGLGPGTYSVTVTDNNGCQGSESVVIIDNGGGCTYTVINSNGFESSWGIWNDGGSDCRRSTKDASYAYAGSRCVRLRDNTSTSVMTTDNLNLASYDEIKINFAYYPRSMDNSNEDFWLQISLNGGSSYTTVEEWNQGDEFENNNFYTDEVTISGPFTSTTRLRFRCDASGNSDWVYIDEVEISGCSPGGSNGNNPTYVGPGQTENTEQITLIDSEVSPSQSQALSDVKLYPNPVKQGLVTVAYVLSGTQEVTLIVTDVQGNKLQFQQQLVEQGRQTWPLNIQHLAPGMYFIHLFAEGAPVTKKFIIAR